MRRAVAIAACTLLAFGAGRWTVPEPPPRVQVVGAPMLVSAPQPAPLAPIQRPALKRRATLEDVRRDWGITGRLVCHTESR